jgi:chromosome segregation ATPase
MGGYEIRRPGSNAIEMPKVGPVSIAAVIESISQARPALIDRARAARKAIDRRDCLDAAIKGLRQPFRSAAELRHKLQDAADMQEVASGWREELDVELRAAVKGNQGAAVERLEGEINLLRRRTDSLRANHEDLAPRLPEIERREAENCASFSERALALRNSRTAIFERAAELLPYVKEYAALARMEGRNKDEANAIAKAAHSAGINLAEIGVDLSPPYRVSDRAGDVPGDLPLGLRIPGIAPADADQAPSWIYQPPVR